MNIKVNEVCKDTNGTLEYKFGVHVSVFILSSWREYDLQFSAQPIL
jgi:hypothetical protein